MGGPLISKKTRLEFREYLVRTSVLRKISAAFDSEDVPCDSDYTCPETGDRRGLVEQYYHAVDWTTGRDVQKVVRVFEGILQGLEDQVESGGFDADTPEKDLKLLTAFLKRDGFVFVNRRLTASGHAISVDEVADATAHLNGHSLRQQIERIRGSVDSDPELAIGTAKELVETICKTILPEYGVTPDKNWDVIRLVKETRTVLKLLPEDIADHAKGADAIRRLLSSLSTVVQSLAEIRNLYGTGHGKEQKAKPVPARHARLAVGTAASLATFFYETHEARKEET